MKKSVVVDVVVIIIFFAVDSYNHWHGVFGTIVFTLKSSITF